MPAVVTRRPYHCLYPLPPHTLYPSTHSLQAKTPVVVARRLILCICSSTPLTVSAHRPICCPQKCQRKLPVDQSFSLPLIPSSLCPSTNPFQSLPVNPTLCPSTHLSARRPIHCPRKCSLKLTINPSVASFRLPLTVSARSLTLPDKTHDIVAHRPTL